MSEPETDWRTWLLFVFTNNDDLDRSMTDDELKRAVCRMADAAPALLAACKAALAELIYDQSPTADYIRAAIAKAEGR